MSRSRDVSQILGKTEAANTGNLALVSSSFDSAEVVTLITANSSNLDSADMQTISGQVSGNRNLLINGAMNVAQRGTSVAMAHDGTTSPYLIDRFKILFGGTHEQLDGTYAQVADHPLSANGKSLKWTTGTAESSYDADEYVYVTQIIEAQNLQLLQYGNSNAQPITLSFYVKSSITGTFAVGFYKEDSTGRMFNKTYTINSANTWEKKTLTFAGDTSGGGIDNNNGRGLYLSWHLSAGSTWTGGGSTSGWVDYANNRWADGQATNAIMTTASATWQLAQCQLEIGDVATAFEHEDIGTTLAKCQRYFTDFLLSANNYMWCCVITGTNTYRRASVALPVQMRASATGTITGATNGAFSSGYPLLEGNNKVQEVNLGGDVTSSAGYAYFTKLQLDAEL